jgi:hypothetical protein
VILREQYVSVNSELSKSTNDGYSPQEIIETHAVAQGLLWAMPDNADSLHWVANHIYTVHKNSPNYIRVLNQVSDAVGTKAVIKLLPRICFLALQTDSPTAIVAYLSKRIASEGAATYLCDCPPRQFCEWVGIDAGRVSKSLRDRTGETPLKDHPWIEMFNQYFDDFESISSIDDRLNLLMGMHGVDTFKMFRPMVTIFEDGDMVPPLTKADTHELAEQWVGLTCDLFEGLRILQPN